MACWDNTIGSWSWQSFEDWRQGNCHLFLMSCRFFGSYQRHSNGWIDICRHTLVHSGSRFPDWDRPYRFRDSKDFLS